MSPRCARRDEAIELYCRAREYSRSVGADRDFVPKGIGHVTESEFLVEAAWVILCSGFRESVVRAKFDYISLCFCDWESAQSIVQAGPSCLLAARKSINNEPKLQAIYEVARRISLRPFDEFRAEMQHAPLDVLERLPYIGKVRFLDGG